MHLKTADLDRALDARSSPAPNPKNRAVELLLMATWFALATGIGEVCILAVRRLLMHEFIRVDQGFVWMTPLANLLLFLPAGAGLAFVALRYPGLASLGVGALLFAFMGFLALVLHHPSLHAVADLLLAAGLATQTARAIGAHPQAFQAFARRTSGWMAVLVVALGVGVHGSTWIAERTRSMRLPEVPVRAPSLLLIVLDTVRAGSLSLYGYARPTTPQLKRFAGTGVTFERALSTSSWTLPSHASLFTGRWPHELTADWEIPLDDTYPTLAEILSARGYRTAGFVANAYASYEDGLHRGFAHYEDYETSIGQVMASSSLGERIFNTTEYGKGKLLRPLIPREHGLGQKTAPDVSREFLRWLGTDHERPFFAFLNYMEAHTPYVSPPPFNTKFGPTKPRRTARFGEAPQRTSRSEHQRRLLNAYDGAINYLDWELGRLLDELGARGALENTLVVITSDHGEQFGEHGLLSHGNSLYMPLLHVPLLISLPGRVPQGVRVTEFVSLRDVPSTVLDLLELDDEPRVPGSSLARFWSGGADASSTPGSPLLSEVRKGIRNPPAYPISRGDMASLVMDGLHYIRNGDGVEELYDLEVDPLEEQNLAAHTQRGPQIARFRAELERLLP